MEFRLLTLSTMIIAATVSGRAVLCAGATPQTLKSSKQGYYKAVATYPKFSERTKVARETNGLILRWIRKEQQRFVKEARKTQESLGMPTAPYHHAIDYVVRHADTMALISVQCEVYQYTGGAHGNSAFVVFNVGIVDGKARRVTLADFFGSDTSYSLWISDTLLSRLKQDDRATFIREGTVRTLTKDQLELFVVQEDGLLFLFNRYDVGPYSAGTFSVKLTLAELGENFNRSLITRAQR